ncbi:hypothetical protein VS_1596 [Vibrio atlanticus]|uniref:Uncharacterized protein n=1 Tax=Vibrio atlanticus (strain LGP32) TaxID=575788 RepID=B7VP32_VIBA3|nr:hypothetical protein VS_1596 [Vibrio atlanticus]
MTMSITPETPLQSNSWSFTVTSFEMSIADEIVRNKDATNTDSKTMFNIIFLITFVQKFCISNQYFAK